MNRRAFLRRLPLATAATAAASSVRAQPTPTPRPIRFGLISDVHHDIMHDAVQRVSAFVETMTEARPEFIAQLGDFCRPNEQNRPFLAAWNRFPGARHHVLGNHDMDGGATRDQAAAFLGMPARHYATRHGGVKFVILDGNEPGGRSTGYARFVGPEQQRWLEEELAAGTEPVIVFIHQALDHPDGIENQDTLRRVLETPRRPDGSPRVLAVFAGHHHQDWVRTLGGIHYLQINSASYFWVGEAFARASYPEAIHAQHPWIRMTCPYRDPLWALVAIDLAAGQLTVEGRASAWVGTSPWERGMSEERTPRAVTAPRVSHRRLPVSVLR